MDAQAKGTIAAAWLNTQVPRRDIALSDYVVNIDIQRSRRNPVPALGYALVVSVGPSKYFIAGRDVQVTFTPNTPGPEIAGLARVESVPKPQNPKTPKPLIPYAIYQYYSA